MKKVLIKNDISIKIMQWVKFSILDCSQPKGIQPKLIGHKLRSGIYWQAMLEQKGIKRGLFVHHIWTNDNLVEWAFVSIQ